jgi:hypothetical protein
LIFVFFQNSFTENIKLLNFAQQILKVIILVKK